MRELQDKQSACYVQGEDDYKVRTQGPATQQKRHTPQHKYIEEEQDIKKTTSMKNLTTKVENYLGPIGGHY
jgi:hypothetical protein